MRKDRSWVCVKDSMVIGGRKVPDVEQRPRRYLEAAHSERKLRDRSCNKRHFTGRVYGQLLKRWEGVFEHKFRIDGLASKKKILARLPNALAFRLQEVILTQLKDFHWREGCYSPSREAAIQILSSHAWGDYGFRHHMLEDLWIENLLTHIDSLVNPRVTHVREWISSNVARFQCGQALASS
ncbi:hypothetical protein BDR05DRAFT_988528 [Suillus weaverae]|nr:hypothetical protein BDR05DRAFT_988528 [Suillus weaverae]